MRARPTNPYCTRAIHTHKALEISTGRALPARDSWNAVLHEVHQADQHQDQVVQEAVVVDFDTEVQIEVYVDGSPVLQTTYTRAAYLHDPDSFEDMLWGVASLKMCHTLTLIAYTDTDADQAGMHAYITNGDRFAAVTEVDLNDIEQIVKEDILGLYEDPALGVHNPVSRKHWKFMIWTEHGLDDDDW